ncbi:MAG: 3-hydroxyacyl-ACP dehydratase FabZ, partial [Nitrospirota bacterium]
AGAGRAVLDTVAIQRYLPHRYPFLLVDRIVELEARRRIVGIKNVTINEPFFQGHFPGYPIMPGVLIIEAMAQVGAVLAFSQEAQPQSKLVFFLGIDKAKFRKPVVPGDQLRMEVTVQQIRSQFWRLQAMAYVDDALVCEAELKAMISDRETGGGHD